MNRQKPDDLFTAVAAVTHRTPPNDDWSLISDIEFAVLTKVSNVLRRVQATPAQINAFAAWFETLKYANYLYRRGLEPWDLPKLWNQFIAVEPQPEV